MDIVGAEQSDRTGVGIKLHRWISVQEPKGRLEMVMDDVRVIDEERRSATVAGFVKQCVWYKMEREQTRKQLSWPSLPRMEPLWIRFLHGSTYYLFTPEAGPAAVNVSSGGFIAKSTKSF